MIMNNNTKHDINMLSNFIRRILSMKYTSNFIHSLTMYNFTSFYIKEILPLLFVLNDICFIKNICNQISDIESLLFINFITPSKQKKIFIAHSGISYDYYFCVGKSIFVGFIFLIYIRCTLACSITSWSNILFLNVVEQRIFKNVVFLSDVMKKENEFHDINGISKSIYRCNYISLRFDEKLIEVFIENIKMLNILNYCQLIVLR